MSKWIVLDLETTGLDPDNDLILEAAAVEVDPHTLAVCGAFSMVNQAFSREVVDARMGAYVRDMHTKNGLLSCIPEEADASSDLEGAIAAFIGEGTKGAILIGNSIHFDRRFMERWPRVMKLLSHRMIDVSSLILCHKQWRGDLPKDSAHRALPDCMMSLDTLRRMRDVFLEVPRG